jgi:hypothetical protein
MKETWRRESTISMELPLFGSRRELGGRKHQYVGARKMLS